MKKKSEEFTKIQKICNYELFSRFGNQTNEIFACLSAEKKSYCKPRTPNFYLVISKALKTGY